MTDPVEPIVRALEAERYGPSLWWRSPSRRHDAMAELRALAEATADHPQDEQDLTSHDTTAVDNQDRELKPNERGSAASVEGGDRRAQQDAAQPARQAEPGPVPAGGARGQEDAGGEGEGDAR